MTFRQFHNERGLTLVELLASLSLLAIVVVLASTVIIQMTNSKEKTGDEISLRQEANVLISELRRQYDDGNSDLCYDQDEMKYSYKVKVNDKLLKGGCTKVDEKNPLHITLNASLLSTPEVSEPDFSLETTWNKKEYRLTSNDDKIFDDKQDFDDLIEDDNDSFDIITTLPSNGEESYTFENNTEFDMSRVGDWDFKEMVVKENAFFPNNFTLNGTYLEVGKNFYAKSFYILDEDAKILIKGGARFNDKLNPTGNNKIRVEDYFFAVGKVFLYNQSTISVGKDATFEENVELQSTTSINIDGNAVFQKALNLHHNAKVIIKGNATFEGPVGYDWSQGTICVKGNATFNSGKGSNLNIIENAKNCN